MKTLRRLLKIVDDAYPDGMVGQYIDLETGAYLDGSGDTLAKFIACETAEVGCEGPLRDRRMAVAGALRTAVRELEEVIEALEGGN